MFTTIWAWIKGLFTAKKLGIILTIFAKKAASVMIKEIMDPVNQQKAYDFVKQLKDRTDLTNREKAEVFNLQMLDWAKKLGKKLSDNMINCLREMAVAALKAEQPCAEANEMAIAAIKAEQQCMIAALKAEQQRIEAKEIK